MKSVLIIGGISTERNNFQYGQFFTEFIKDYYFEAANYDELSYIITPSKFSILVTKLGKEISEYDLVIFRGRLLQNHRFAYVISLYLKHHGTPFFNDYSFYRSSSKLTQAAYFFEQKVPFVDTYFSLNKDDFKKIISDNLSLPFVLKDDTGSHGENNFLIKSKAELNQKLNKENELTYIAQPYHANTHDYRVLVAGAQPPLVIKRIAGRGTHLNNTSRGADAELVNELPQRLIKTSKRLAERLGMSLAGVDILPDSQTGEYFFLEINSQPQILTGAFVEEKRVAIKKLLNNYLN